MDVLFFSTPSELREWFQENHLKEQQVWIGFYNKKSGRKSITWKETVDEALCFGWIDGIRKKLDDHSYSNRLTPRRKKSNWSDVNIARIEELIELGLVTETGKHTYYNRDTSKQKSASFEQEKVEFPPAYLKKFKTNKNAWKFYERQSNTYRKQSTWYVISAKQEMTRLRRLEQLIEDCENGIHIQPLRRTTIKPK